MKTSYASTPAYTPNSARGCSVWCFSVIVVLKTERELLYCRLGSSTGCRLRLLGLATSDDIPNFAVLVVANACLGAPPPMIS